MPLKTPHVEGLLQIKPVKNQSPLVALGWKYRFRCHPRQNYKIRLYFLEHRYLLKFCSLPQRGEGVFLGGMGEVRREIFSPGRVTLGGKAIPLGPVKNCR
ncbi:hypothetical protein TNCV_2982301 [Trichonephila clavipes]|nr:hypothetical protein TNCV_2982301 [Trichonephila clavipes]